MWKTLSEKIVHKNKWYQVIQKNFEMPSKKRGEYFIVKTKDASIIIPVINDEILFIKQFRYPINKFSLELPAGGIEIDVTPQKTAQKELQEETGFIAKKMKKIGKFASACGFSSEICHVFLAKNLNFIGTNMDATEDIKAIKIKIKDAYIMIEQGKIIDGLTISALALAKKYLIKK